MNILIVDDHALFRCGLVQLLHALHPQPETCECGELGKALELLESRHDIDLVFLDLRLEDAIGVDSLHSLRERYPDIPVIVLSGEQDHNVIHRCIDMGAMGFITKSSSPEALYQAISKILDGGVYLPREAMLGGPSACDQHGTIRSDTAVIAALSERQREVLGYLLQGKPNKTISARMNISENTVKAHLSAIFRTLGARNRTEAVYFAARAGVNME